jgi:hypothetical protein
LFFLLHFLSPLQIWGFHRKHSKANALALIDRYFCAESLKITAINGAAQHNANEGLILISFSPVLPVPEFFRETVMTIIAWDTTGVNYLSLQILV